MTKMTTGSPWRLILAFAIPMLIGNIFQQLYSMADMYIVGHTISADALGAIGCTGSVSGLIIGFAQGLTGGFCILTAQHYGAGDVRKVKESFVTGLVLSALFIVLLTALGGAILKPFLRAMHTREELFADAYAYIQIIMAGLGATILYNYFAGILRAFGDSRRPLYVLIIACLVNIALDYLFILAFHMGVRGAALATVLSQLLSAVLCLCFILRNIPELRLKRGEYRTDGEALWKHLRVGFPMGFQWSLISVGQIVMQSALNQLSVAAVTAFTAAMKIDTLAVQPSFSFGSSMGTYVPQNFGANDPARIRRGVRTCCAISCTLCFLIGVVNAVFGGRFAAFFVGAGETEVISLVHRYLIINGSCYFLHALLMIYRNSAQGLGRTVSPVLAGIMELAMRFVTAWVLVRFWGFTGACLSSPLAWIAAAIPLGVSYHMGLSELERKVAAGTTA